MSRSTHSDRYRTFRALLIEARKIAGLTQQELAGRLAQPQSFVSKYEKGERRLDVVECYEIAGAIGLDPAKFMVSIVAALDEISRLEEKCGSRVGAA